MNYHYSVLIAGTWFGDNERALVTTITSLASVIGVIIGFAMPAFFVKDDDDQDVENAKDKIWIYILVQSITITVLSLPIFFLVRNSPRSAPSRSARRQKEILQLMNEENADSSETQTTGMRMELK
jgi:sugar phosphate permease